MINRSCHLPNGYSIHIAKNYKDTWKVFKLLVLKRERETNKMLGSYSAFLFLFGFLSCFAAIYYFSEYDKSWLLLIIVTVASFCLTTIIIFCMSFFGIVYLNFILIKKKTRRLLIAFYKGKLIGASLLGFRRNHCVLLGLYVCPSHRKKGVGSVLIHHILRGISEPVYVCAMTGLTSFYKDSGFIEDKEIKGYNMVYRFGDN